VRGFAQEFDCGAVCDAGACLKVVRIGPIFVKLLWHHSYHSKISGQSKIIDSEDSMADLSHHSGFNIAPARGTYERPVFPEARHHVVEGTTGRTLRRFLGMVFAFAAIGLWVAPGANWSSSVLLFKTGLTAILCFCAIVALLPRVTRR
jgi:hypothetical protein